MKNLVWTALALSLAVGGLLRPETATAQSAVLAEVYGRGVHAYYAGHTTEAYDTLSLAINNGLKDPRAYYFRGIVAEQSGRMYEAESDWRQGAELEAAGKIGGDIGRALSRYQGRGRLKLEQIRQKAKLEYLALSNARAQQRYGEIGDAEDRVLQTPPAATRPAPVVPGSMEPRDGAAPAPPAAAAENPFAEDLGEPNIESDDALADAMDDPFADDPAAAADPAGDAPATDPFGGGGDANPFGGDAGGAMDDPFGDAGDPFGN